MRRTSIQDWRVSAAVTVLAAASTVTIGARQAAAQEHPAGYRITTLTSSTQGEAPEFDPDLVGPRGLARGPAGPWWVSVGGGNKVELFNGDGVKQQQQVSLGLPPTGIVYNPTAQFSVQDLEGRMIDTRFLIAAADGTISVWAPLLAGTTVTAVDNRGQGAIYTGLALADLGNGDARLYAADFHNGRVDVFDGALQPVMVQDAFVDAQLPAGFAPYGIQEIGGKIFVAFALQNNGATAAITGQGAGLVRVFDLDGQLVARLTSQRPLDAPWGMTRAPQSYGPQEGALLVANSGDGSISAFEWQTWSERGPLKDIDGHTLLVEGLHGLGFGNGEQAGDALTLYYTSHPGGGAQGRVGKEETVNGTIKLCGECGSTADCVTQQPALTCVNHFCVDSWTLTIGQVCKCSAQCANNSCSPAGHCQCTSNADCPNGQVCSPKDTNCATRNPAENQCKAKSSECGCCDFNSDCGGNPANLVCVANTASSNPPSMCIAIHSKNPNDPCCHDQQCSSDICCGSKCVVGGLNIGDPCCDPRQCGSHICCNTACQQANVLNTGDPCCADGQCKTGACSSSRHKCVCKKDSDCPAGHYCAFNFFGPGDNTCNPFKNECEDCLLSSHCKPGALCKLGKCATGNSKVMGQSCCRDWQCSTGSCGGGINKVCQCANNSHCPAGQYCAIGFLGIGQNKCVPLKSECAACLNVSQCQPGAQCLLGRCVTPNSRTMGQSCCANNECTTGSCSLGANRVCQCNSNNDCPGGTYCAFGFLGIGQNHCVAFKPECAWCTLSSQCGPGALCRLGKCATGQSLNSGQSCCRDWQCKSGNCKLNGKCK